MGKPTIAVLSYHFWKHPRAIKIAQTLTKQGYRVKVWGFEPVFKRGPRVFRGVLNYLLAMLRVARLDADIYWVENIPDIIYLPLPLTGKRYIYDRRSPWAKEISLELSVPKPISKIAEIVERYMVAKATRIAVVSTPMKLEYNYEKPVTVVPNYPEKRFVEEPTITVREELRVPSRTKIFGFIGKLSKVEGTDLLVDVANKLEEIPGTELWIIGDGPLRELAKALAKKPNVRWFGWIDRKKLPPYIASFDYGLVPRHRHVYRIFYNHEGIQKIGEYFAYGKPVIASGIAPSPYYLVVEPEEFAETVAKVARGELKPPPPPKNLYWETVSEHKIQQIVASELQTSPLGEASR